MDSATGSVGTDISTKERNQPAASSQFAQSDAGHLDVSGERQENVNLHILFTTQPKQGFKVLLDQRNREVRVMCEKIQPTSATSVPKDLPAPGFSILTFKRTPRDHSSVLYAAKPFHVSTTAYAMNACMAEKRNSFAWAT